MNYNETTLHQQIWHCSWDKWVPWKSKLPMSTQKDTANLVTPNLSRKSNPLLWVSPQRKHQIQIVSPVNFPTVSRKNNLPKLFQNYKQGILTFESEIIFILKLTRIWNEKKKKQRPFFFIIIDAKLLNIILENLIQQYKKWSLLQNIKLA